MAATKQDLLRQMTALRACSSATEWAQTSNLTTAQDIWNACETPAWMLWYAARCGVEHKTLVRLAAAFARSVLFLVPENEQRPRICVETVEAWCDGNATIEQVKVARRNAYAAVAYAAAAVAYAAAAAAVAAAAADAAYVYAAVAAAAAADAVAADAADAADAAADAADAADAAETRKQVQLAQCELIRKAIPVVPFRGES